MPLVELCLQVKLLSLSGIKQFLSKAREPPMEEAIASAVLSLYEIGAIEGNEELWPLGYHLAKLHVDVLIRKTMIYGGIFGCLSPILALLGLCNASWNTNIWCVWYMCTKFTCDVT